MNDSAADLPPKWDRPVRFGIAGLLLVVATLAAFKCVSVSVATVMAGLILLATILVALPLERIKSLTSLKAFGIEFTLAELAIEEAPSAGLDSMVDADSEAHSIIDLQLLLEAKLAYVAKHILNDRDNCCSGFLTIGSLEYDDYLTREDALAARRLLGLRAADIESASRKQRADYMSKAKPFVRNIRATIFNAVVKQVLIKDYELRLVERPRGKGKRPDLEVKGQDGTVRVFAAFTGGGALWTKKKIQERARSLSKSADRSLIVVMSETGGEAKSNSKKLKKIDVPRVSVVSLLDMVNSAPKLSDLLPPRKKPTSEEDE